jgi:phosphate transport system permease protein
MATVMTGVPSIVMGLFVYIMWTMQFGYSAFGGALALACLMLPVVIGSTEQMLRLVPDPLREAAYALGATKSRTITGVVLPAALPGIITGVLLALARVAGETAPLLFTSLNNAFFSTDPRQPISTLTVQVYSFATSPYPEWHQQAWAGALVLVTMVFSTSVLARFATARMERMQRGS